MKALLSILVCSAMTAVADPILSDPGPTATNNALIFYPIPYISTNTYPIMIWCHGSSYDKNDPTSSYNNNLSTSILTNGWFICSHDAEYNNWGNQASLDDYKNLMDWALIHLPNNNKVVLFGESMGGLDSLLLANYRTNVTVGCVEIYPVCSLSNAYFGGLFVAAMNAAYSMTSTNYATQTVGHDPLLLSTNNFRLRMRFYASYSDTVVPQSQHTDLMRTLVSGVATEYGLVECTGNHGDASHFQPDDVNAFLKRCLVNVTNGMAFGTLNVGTLRIGP